MLKPKIAALNSPNLEKCILKEIISYKNFCEEKGLVLSSKKSQAEYQRYTNECDIENRPYYNDIYKQAQEIKNAKKK